MNKTTKMAAGIIIILIISLGVVLTLNHNNLEQQKIISTNAEILLKTAKAENTLSFENIKKAGEENFEAILDTAKSDPITYTYTGVQLKNILKQCGLDLQTKKTVILSAVDGFTVAYTMDEVLKNKNIYLAYAREGAKLKDKDAGGNGPYMSIVVSDPFSSRRCKWLTTIEVQ